MNTQGLARYLEQCQVHVAGVQTCQITGRLTRINGLVMEASGLKLPLGASAPFGLSLVLVAQGIGRLYALLRVLQRAERVREDLPERPQDLRWQRARQ